MTLQRQQLANSNSNIATSMRQKDSELPMRFIGMHLKANSKAVVFLFLPI